DEIPHISGGYYYLKTGRYFINPEHPPLVKDIAGLGEIIVHPKLPDITNQTELPADFHRAEYPFIGAEFPKALEWQNNQDHFGTMFLFQPPNNPDKIAFFARLAVIFANTLFLFLLFVLLKKIWSERAALLGLFFFAVSQFSIAHGSFVVIDFMSAILTGIAIISFALYLKTFAEEGKTAKYFLLTSVFFALALLSKFSSVVLLPAAFLGGLAYVFFIRGETSNRALCKTKIIAKYLFAFAAIVIVALFLVSLFYVFHTYKMEDSVLIQKLHENYPEEQFPAVGHKILEAMVWSNSLTKGLAAYINGVFMVMSRMIVSAQSTYFLGHVYGNEGAGIWYFPILYLAKLSPGLHLFSILSLTLIFFSLFKRKGPKIKKRLAKFFSNPLSLLLWVFIFCYMAVTLRSTFQIGLRHIMPVILAAAILTGRGADLFWERKFFRSARLKHLFLVVSTLMVFSVFCSFPYYLEYYNFLAGGTDKGYKVATDSNYDWGGSDVRRLGKWMRDNNVSEIYTQIFADVPLKYYLGEKQKFYNLQDTGILPPSGSYIAVSVMEYMNNVYSADISPERKYTILQNNLVARVGKTIFVYRVP
ncbi:MAG: phospholipid carrier-dependent glycosyltransferase, partial [Candidatus Moranbacteria bacterium]|nr:phospholipid carrier-dependent glycosyltransferase [Candidatus Moranbacteria bacterium]